MMDADKAVQYQNPAHVHFGTSNDTFTVAEGAADKTRLTQTGIERVGASAELPLELAAKGKGAVNALGGPLVVGPCNTVFGGFLPRPYTADPEMDPYLLIISGGDYTAEFTDYYVSFTDGERYRQSGASSSYNAELDQTEICLDEMVSASNGFVVGTCAQGLVAGFGNIAAGSSVALGLLCLSVGAPSFAAGLSSSALGLQSFAVGSSALAYGTGSVAVGSATAAGHASCALGSARAGSYASSIQSLVGTTVRIYGDVRSRFAMYDTALIFSSRGDRLETTITSDPVYAGGITTFEIIEAPTFAAEYIVDTAMGVGAFAAGGSQATGSHAHAETYSVASGTYAHSEGSFTTASGQAAHAEGSSTTASGQYAHSEGYYTTASAKAAHAGGYYSLANKQYQRALSSGRFADVGDCQYTEVVLRRATTSATPAELTLDGSTPSGTTENTSNRFICATGKTYACLVMIAARESDGTSALFIRQVLVKNVSGTVSLEGAVQTVGVDINPAGWTTPSITADNTNKALVITVTGAASTNIRWSATVQAQEIKY